MSFWKKIGNSLLGGIPSLIEGGINLIGSAFGNSAAEKQIRLQNEGNIKLAQYQYEKNLEQWQRENAYNSPRSQMQRFADAGLNPMLMYGQGSSGQAASSPQLEMPKLAAYTDYGDMGASGAVAAFQRGQQIDQMESLREAQENLAKSQADYNRQRSLTEAVNRTFTEAKKAAQLFKNGLMNKYGEKQILASLSKSFQQVNTMKAQEANYYSQKDLNEKRAILVEKQALHEIEKMNLTKAQRLKVLVDMQYIRANIRKIGAEIELIGKKKNLTQNESANAYITNQILQGKAGIVGKENKTWYARLLADYALQLYRLQMEAGKAAIGALL